MPEPLKVNPLRDVLTPKPPTPVEQIAELLSKGILSPSFFAGVQAHIKAAKFINAFKFGEGPVTSPRTCGYISQLLTMEKGDYIETGTRFGGSALVASLFEDSVVTIDPAYEKEFSEVMEKVAKVGRDKITRIGKKSSDVKRLPKRNYTVGLIDGSHEYDDAMVDFVLFDKYVSNFIILDDVDLPGVSEAIRTIINSYKAWTLVSLAYPTTAVFAKTPNSNVAYGAF